MFAPRVSIRLRLRAIFLRHPLAVRNGPFCRLLDASTPHAMPATRLGEVRIEAAMFQIWTAALLWRGNSGCRVASDGDGLTWAAIEMPLRSGCA